MVKAFEATPLFDAHSTFIRLPMGSAMLDEYPDSRKFIDNTASKIPGANQTSISRNPFLRATVVKVKLLIVAIVTRLSVYCFGPGLSRKKV